MKYEYKHVVIELTAEQQRVVEIGMAKPHEACGIIQEVISEQAELGWEPLYPFGFPVLWFRREVKTRRTKTTTRKKVTRSAK
jgi:hypothetical protein